MAGEGIQVEGREKAAACVRILHEIWTRWQKRFGAEHIARLRASLESIIHAEAAEGPTLLMQAIVPYPDNCRAQISLREVLPAFPWCSTAADTPTKAEYPPIRCAQKFVSNKVATAAPDSTSRSQLHTPTMHSPAPARRRTGEDWPTGETSRLPRRHHQHECDP
jgi:hypothetical protein